MAKDQNVKSVFVVTAIGANPKAKLFYPRLKDEVERDINRTAIHSKQN